MGYLFVKMHQDLMGQILYCHESTEASEEPPEEIILFAFCLVNKLLARHEYFFKADLFLLLLWFQILFKIF